MNTTNEVKSKKVKRGSGAGGKFIIKLPDDFFVETADTRQAELVKLRKENEELITLCKSMWEEMQRCDGYYRENNKNAYLILMEKYNKTK